SFKPVARSFDLEFHQSEKLWSCTAGCDHVLRYTEAAHVIQWKINSSLAVVDRNVLPEVRQLQGGAGEIGEFLPLCIAISAGIEHQPADGIGGILAIAKQVFEALVARCCLVLAKRL